MKTGVFLLFLCCLSQSAVSQQCDVVVTSHASLKKELESLLGSGANAFLQGNTTCSGISNAVVEELETRLDTILETKLEVMLERIQETIEDTTRCTQCSLGTSPRCPSISCAEILQNDPSALSDYYWISSSCFPGYSVKRYCDMTRSCGGVTGGWMRVAHLDMTNSSQQCPNDLRQRSDSGRRTCSINSDSAACSSVIFPVNTCGYSKVCGKIKAFQYGSPDSFGLSGRRSNSDINGNYVDGVSLTAGFPRRHLWTFAGALDEVGTYPQYNCPCTNTNQVARACLPPSFVGNDYFCDTASVGRFQFRFYGDDPLWDGAGCGPRNACCSFNRPPWFFKQLPHPTTDNIEMRVCRDQNGSDEDIAIEKIEIYVQ